MFTTSMEYKELKEVTDRIQRILDSSKEAWLKDKRRGPSSPGTKIGVTFHAERRSL